MGEVQTNTDADRELKARHRAMWALGDYASVASEVIPTLGERLAEAAGCGPGQRVLDVAAGSGNAAIPAARRGARVVAADLTPELLEAGRHLAEAEDLSLEWRQADAEALPFGDGDFDAVISCVGVMFAPHHQAAADELVRVLRPGGTLALLSWTPQGFIGELFGTMRNFVPPPPKGVQPPPLWGDVEHVRGLLGDRVTGVEARRETLRVERFARADEFRDFFKHRYGPTVAAYRGLADDPAKVAALDAALDELAQSYLDEGGGTMGWDYLLLTARRA
jgi:SAM-dependent methyltransferase